MNEKILTRKRRPVIVIRVNFLSPFVFDISLNAIWAGDDLKHKERIHIDRVDRDLARFV